MKGFSTRVSLKNAENKVRPGMTANLTVPLISAGNVLAVPLGAIFNEQGETFVHVQTGDAKFERRPIQVGVANYDFVEITKGLVAGDVISLVAPTANAGGKAAGASAQPRAASK